MILADLSPDVHRLLKSTIKLPFNTYLGTSFSYLTRKMLKRGCRKQNFKQKLRLQPLSVK
jgi:hypothetical protein